MLEEKSCGAVILRPNENDDYDALLIKHVAGHWGFPKGHIKDGESEMETAIREVKEETGYDIVVDETFREVSSYLPSPGVHKQVVYFVGNICGGAIGEELDGVEKAEWFSYAEALALLSYPSDMNILRNVRKFIQQFTPEE